MVGSSPTLGTICLFGEMDIIFVFETKGVGSIPARGAKIAIVQWIEHDTPKVKTEVRFLLAVPTVP